MFFCIFSSLSLSLFCVLQFVFCQFLSNCAHRRQYALVLNACVLVRYQRNLECVGSFWQNATVSSSPENLELPHADPRSAFWHVAPPHWTSLSAVAPQFLNGDSSHTVRKLTTCKKELSFAWSPSKTKFITMFQHWKPSIIMVTKISHMLYFVGRDSSVGIATRYGLDIAGIESRRGRDFPHPSRPAQWST